MKRVVKKTEDGSPTYYVPELNEHYHSTHGAFQESQIVYIKSGFNCARKSHVKILEYGFGTGINAILTFLAAQEQERTVEYHSVEKYPLSLMEVKALNIKDVLGLEHEDIFMQIHESDWGKQISLQDRFVLFKEKADFRTANHGKGFDVVYFDAFGPEVQPALWTKEVFNKVYESCSDNAVLTTYSVKGTVRRNLKNAGFKVEKIPGPQGKREMTRALKM